MKRLLISLALTIAVTGCGGSSGPTLAQRCHTAAVKWTKSYVAPFASTVSQARFDQLEQTTENLCLMDPKHNGPDELAKLARQ